MLNIQKTRAILALNFICLFILIISVPFLIQHGTKWFSEETIETFFLFAGLSALVYLFSQYDYYVGKQQQETLYLNAKLKTQERELLDAFQHLGKVNVQVSMIRTLLEKTKVPKTKNQLKSVYGELLSLVSSITHKKFAYLRIINLENARTLDEFLTDLGGNRNEIMEKFKIGNNELIRKFKKNQKGRNSDWNDFRVFYSSSSNFSIKAFVFVPCDESSRSYEEERNFLQAVANQCEIIYLLFNSQFYQPSGKF